jgi:predicted enzyme related to lactoylglutathione lyase
MSVKLRSIVIATSKLKEVISFYELLGLSFQKKVVTLGTEFYWTIADDLEIAFIEKSNIAMVPQPHYMLSFRVADVDKFFLNLTGQGFIGVLDPTVFNEGRKAILLDPDGRSVELIQTADH